MTTILKSHYDITPVSVSKVCGGFSAKAAYHVVDTKNMAYFVKVYDKTLPTTRFFVERIDLYMPVLDWLSKKSTLQGRVLTPVMANEGLYQVETEAEAYTLFHYVNGETPGIQGITREQTIALGHTLAHLHEAAEHLPFETTGLAEDVTLPFCERLAHFLAAIDNHKDTLADILNPHKDMLQAAVDDALRLRDTIRLGYAPLVLCHGDAHGNNVMQGKQLVLVDWEDLRWAPAEADLFIHAWHPYPDTLLEAYIETRPDFSVNHELLRFYVLRRRIEDVWVDIERLTEENPPQEEAAELHDWIRLGIEGVRKAYHTPA